MGSRAKFRLESECSQVSICSNCENEYSEVAPDLGPRRMTKPSLSESLLSPQYHELQKQYAEIILSYHKLKISFTVMLVLNAILLVVVIVCLVLFIPHLLSVSHEKTNPTKNDTPTPPRTGEVIEPSSQPSPLSEKDSMVIKCNSIKDKLGKLYMKGQKVDQIFHNSCSIEDLIDSFTQYIKLKRNEDNRKAAFHFSAQRVALSDCRDIRVKKCLKNWEVKMNTSEVNVNQESIIVPETGVYFIYNRVTINIDGIENTNTKNYNFLGDIRHSLRYSDTGSNFKDLEQSNIECIIKNKQFNHVSSIEQVHSLVKGAEIRIAVELPSNINKYTTHGAGSFGMFQL